MLELLYAANAITRDVLRYGAVEHVSYRVNQSALEEFSAEKRAAARVAGEPESETRPHFAEHDQYCGRAQGGLAFAWP